ncbi:MAG: hypothetical protein V7K68_30520 [Nostoc sp.]|uniref:hypothetical protein n=1 Tax=Nostoc sp. TaxID=1180 RepID=UPI002FF5DCAB
MMEAFKNEIIEAEKGRTDLLKWKLILVAALGAIGLGISNPSSTSKPMLSLHLALCLIPLVCVYVDLLCKHLQMRILVISEFFQNSEYRNNADEDSCFYLYERFCDQVRSVFNLEDWAQQWSTQFLSVLVIVAALILKLQKTDLLVLVFSGMCGIIFTLVIDKAYENKRKSLKKEARKLNLHEVVQGELGNASHTK